MSTNLVTQDRPVPYPVALKALIASIAVLVAVADVTTFALGGWPLSAPHVAAIALTALVISAVRNALVNDHIGNVAGVIASAIHLAIGAAGAVILSALVVTESLH